MAILITSPVAGSLKITNTGTSASPQTQYFCNLQTVTVYGQLTVPAEQDIYIANEQQQTIWQAKLSNLTNIGASGFNFTLQNAVDAIASLIMK